MDTRVPRQDFGVERLRATEGDPRDQRQQKQQPLHVSYLEFF